MPDPRPSSPAVPARAASPVVEDLIRRAVAHPLGVSYLLHGAPDSVAATFGVHAFAVDQARARLRQAPPPTAR